MTELLLAKIKRKIDKSDPKQVGWLNFIIVSFYFGLRPSEVMAVVKKPIVENHNGIPVLVVDQTKLTSISEEDRIKKIPVICEQQMTALGLISSGNVLRPHSSWVDQLFKDPKITYGPTEDFGLYTGRKGFTDLMLTLGQSLEDISGWLGQHSIDMTWKVYKTKNLINFNQTDFVKKNFRKPKSKPKKVS
jgi:integrase